MRAFSFALRPIILLAAFVAFSIVFLPTVHAVDPLLTVTVNVINDNGGTQVIGDFTARVDGIAATSGASSGYSIAVHTVSVDAVYGYASTISGDCAADGSITLNDSDIKACTVTVDDIAPKITITATVTNDNGGSLTTGAVPLFLDASSVTSGVQTTTTVGSHIVSETAQVGYTSVISGDCSSIGAIILAIGDEKSCTIAHNDIQPQLTVTVSVINDNGGTLLPSDLLVTVTGSNVVPSSFNGTSLGTLVALDAGAFSAGVPSVSGYSTLLSADCSGTLTVGDTKSCTITLDDIQPLLTVTVNVINDNGGTKVIGDFTARVDGIAVTSGTSSGYSIAAHTVSIDAMYGYTATISGNCSSLGAITLVAGDTKSCTVTVDDIAPKLTVTKVIVNDHGGTVIVTDVPLFIDATPVTSGVQNTTTVGLHTVSETNPGGYASIIIGDCSSTGAITLVVGDEKSCIITNNDIQPQLTVIVSVINDNGGTLLASNFRVTVTGSSVVPSSFSGTSLGTLALLNAGSFTAGVPARYGYLTSLSADCVGTLLPGDTKSCTITLDDIQPLLTVTTVVVNDHGGLKTIANFPLTVSSVSVTSGVQQGFNAGTYAITSAADSTYTQVITGHCTSNGSITMVVGDVRACTVTRDDIPPTLTLIKTVRNDNGANIPSTGFFLTIRTSTGFIISPLTGSTTTLRVGDFVVGEDFNRNYELAVGGSCDPHTRGIHLELAENITCTLFNDDIPGNDIAREAAFNAKHQIAAAHSGQGTRSLSSIVRFLGEKLPQREGIDRSFDAPFSYDEQQYICSIKKAQTANTAQGLDLWIAEKMSSVMQRPAEDIHAALVSPGYCNPPKVVEKKSAPIAIHIDAQNIVLSTNPVWNACVTGNEGLNLALIRSNKDRYVYRRGNIRKEFAFTCRDYHRGNVSLWQHPDFPELKVTLDKRGALLSALPIGYIALRDGVSVVQR